AFLVLALIDQLVLADPRHHRAQLRTDLLDLVSGGQTTAGGHFRVVGTAFQDEALGVFTVLDVGQAFLHGGTGFAGNHARTGHVLAVLGVVRDRVVHGGNAAFVHQIDDQLQLVQALEVGHFRRVAGIDQGFKAGLDQLDGAAAEHGLFAEQVGFGFFTEVGFDHAGLAATVGGSVGEGDVLGLAGLVLIDSDQGRHAAALEVLGTHGVARALRRDHDDVEVVTRDHLVVVHVEAVSEGQGGALLHVGGNVVLVNGGAVAVRQQHPDDIRVLHGRGDFRRGVTGGLGLAAGCTALAQGDGDVHGGLLEVQGVSGALRAVADDGDLLALAPGDVGVSLVI